MMNLNFFFAQSAKRKKGKCRKSSFRQKNSIQSFILQSFSCFRLHGNDCVFMLKSSSLFLILDSIVLMKLRTCELKFDMVGASQHKNNDK